jgi:hypothetical protein
MLGLEYRPIPRLGLELNYGFRFTGLQPFYWNRDKENLRYQKIKAEVRYYIPRDEKTQWYVAGEAFYVPQEYDLKKGNFYRGGEFRAYDRAHIEREVRGAALKAGLIRRLGRKPWVWAYATGRCVTKPSTSGPATSCLMRRSRIL